MLEFLKTRYEFRFKESRGQVPQVRYKLTNQLNRTYVPKVTKKIRICKISVDLFADFI